MMMVLIYVLYQVSRRSLEKALNLSYSDINAFMNEPDMFLIEQKDSNTIIIKKPEHG
jgi:hypothetical protein